MNEFRFTDEYIKKIEMLKSDKFKESLYSNLRRLNEYLREDEYEEIYSAIEEAVQIKESGNIIISHSFGTFTEAEWKSPETFIQRMIEDLFDWFIWEENPIKCSLFLFCLHIDDYDFSDEDLDKLTHGVMSNFIMNGIPCPDVWLLPTEGKKKELENGYYILGLK